MIKKIISTHTNFTYNKSVPLPKGLSLNGLKLKSFSKLSSQGACSTVYKLRFKLSKEQVFFCLKTANEIKEKSILNEEIDTLNRLIHSQEISPYIMLPVFSISSTAIVFPLASTNLTKYMRCHTNRKSTQVLFKEIPLQLLQGLEFIHQNSIVHRDIKPDNILITVKSDETILAQITDLGLAKPEGKFYRAAGTHRYRPPESFKDGYICHRSHDMWSMGITFFEILKNQLTDILLPPSCKKTIFHQNLKAISQKCLKENTSERISEKVAINFLSNHSSSKQAI